MNKAMNYKKHAFDRLVLHAYKSGVPEIKLVQLQAGFQSKPLKYLKEARKLVTWKEKI
jgi:hypothetical protein